MGLRKKSWFRIFLKIIFLFFMGVCLLFLSFLFLGSHLLRIQVPERLRYIKDYQDFKLEVKEKPNCTNEIIFLFQQDDVLYEGLCIDEVYVLYGKTKAPLQLVLENHYLTLQDILKKLSVVLLDDNHEVTNPRYYEYHRSDVENQNYQVTLYEKEYQQANVTEVTFEVFYEEEPIPAEVSGTVEISG